MKLYQLMVSVMVGHVYYDYRWANEPGDAVEMALEGKPETTFCELVQEYKPEGFTLWPNAIAVPRNYPDVKKFRNLLDKEVGQWRAEYNEDWVTFTLPITDPYALIIFLHGMDWLPKGP